MQTLRDKKLLIALVALLFTVLIVLKPGKAPELQIIEKATEGVVDALPDQPATQPAVPSTLPVGGAQ